MGWWWFAVAAAAAIAGLLLYWALGITEGSYLGRRVVALLYDWTPAYYDRIKAITWLRDREWLIDPLLERLSGVQEPLVLDVGTGTGRFPAALLGDRRFSGQIWALDISRGMLRRAYERLKPYGRCHLIWHDADTLPFRDGLFDAVVCLETIEFTPRPQHTIHELVRVLGPGGTLLISNRIGRARWFPGRAYNDQRLLALFSAEPLKDALIHNWNGFYDLVWARKAGQAAPMEHQAEDLGAQLCSFEPSQIGARIAEPRAHWTQYGTTTRQEHHGQKAPS